MPPPLTSIDSSSSTSLELESQGYTLRETIKEGTFYVIKRAQAEDGTDVAVKMVCKTRAPDKHLGKFLPREIMSHYLISHDNVIKFRQAIESMYRIYFVTEYAENGSLLDLILEESYIDETRGRVWFRQLVDAVDYCHRIGVVHRDIRCDNLLFDGNYTLKLSNFGFARAQMLPGKVDGCYPLSDTYCGSYAYSAPEVIKGVPYYPQAADVWSMGVVLFAMVFGKLPFDDTNYPKLIKAIQSRVVFPGEPEVSVQCLSLISKIFTPAVYRIRIPGLKTEPWMEEPEFFRFPFEDEEEESFMGGYVESDLDTRSEKVYDQLMAARDA